MRFWIGVVVGLVIGSGATWLVTAKPWRGSAPVAVVADAGAVEVKKSGKKAKRRRGGRRGGGNAGDRGGGEDDVEPAPPELSAADRMAAQRGPAIALPRRSVDMGSSDDARPLSAGEINDVIQSSSQGILGCIESSREGALLSGDVELEMLVGGDGTVDKIRVSAPRWLLDHGLYDCAAGAARRWRFPATGAPTVVDAPYHID